MSAQFIHINTYARESKSWSGTSKAGKAKGGTTSSIRQVVAEATREPGNCPHVDQPLPPITLYGVDASQIPQMCDEYAETVKDSIGRKLQKTGLVCIAGVVSVGEPDKEKWESVKADSLTFLKEKYGERLKSVVEHKDEAFSHFHFYVIPKPGEKLEDIHEGLKARNSARKNGEKAGTQNKKYRDAMKGLQDAYSLQVSAKNGLTRIGPSRRRLSRDGWRAEQAAAEDQANRQNLMADTRKVAETAYKSGLKKGYASGFEKGTAAAAGAANFVKNFIGGLHKPTLKMTELAAETEKKLAKEKAARKAAEAKIQEEKEEANRRVKEVYENAKADKQQPDIQLKRDLETAKAALESERKARREAEAVARELADKNNALHREQKQKQGVKI